MEYNLVILDPEGIVSLTPEDFSELENKFYTFYFSDIDHLFTVFLKYKPNLILIASSDSDTLNTQILQVKSLNGFKKIPIIAIGKSHSLKACFEVGVVDFLRMPINKSELVIRTKNAIFNNNEIRKVGMQNDILERLYQKNRQKTINLFGKHNDLKLAKKEIIQQKREIEKQRDRLRSQNREITDSIQYAGFIQSAILPHPAIMENLFNEHFIVNYPRDIVSGDFYWADQIEDKVILAVGDCTGHGVPGAFMSMLGISLLNEVIYRSKIYCPSDILNSVRDDLIDTLHQTGKEGGMNDGLDLSLCVFDFNKMILEFAGAYNSIYVVKDGVLKVFKGDKMPIGFHLKDDDFTKQTIQLEKGNVVYLFTDGFVDQFGGKYNKKFLASQFKSTLIKNWKQPLWKQKKILEDIFRKWKGDNSQVDDVLVLGVKV